MSGNFAALQCLAGVKVVDLTQFEAGPTCTEARWLGRKGEDEPEPRRRPARQHHAKASDLLFQDLNAIKKSATVDSVAEGRRARQELSKADVFAENPPRCRRAPGLGYDVLKEINPGII